LLGRTLELRCGDLDVKLAPVGPTIASAPERDRLQEGDDAKKEFEETMYGSA
jgi:hypothetical protein